MTTTSLPTTGALALTASPADTDRLAGRLAERYRTYRPDTTPPGPDLLRPGSLLVCDVDGEFDAATWAAARCRSAGVGLLVCARDVADVPAQLGRNLATRW